MNRQKGQAVVEWVLILAAVTLGMAFLLMSKSYDKKNFREIIADWYQAAAEDVARAGVVGQQGTVTSDQ